MMSKTLIERSKLQTNNFEISAVHNTRPTVVLKTKTPEQILQEVRNRKIAQLNQYKEVPTDKKFKDIQSLLSMMNTHGKFAKTDKVG